MDLVSAALQKRYCDMKIAIIGWYGTETIGDRAILSGILSLCKSCFDTIEIKLGSIYPFFTERTLLEDESYIRRMLNIDSLPIELFSTRKRQDLNQAVCWSDILMIGGGPLEDIPSMFMLEYAFSFAKRRHKKCVVLGCGLGPLYKKCYQKSTAHIIDMSDLTILRDETSVKEYERFSHRPHVCLSAVDPSLFCLSFYRAQNFSTEKKHHIVASLRSFPHEYKIHKNIDADYVNGCISELLSKLAVTLELPVLLCPMHYFKVGDDDRYFLNELKFLGNNSYEVQNMPLTLEETMQLVVSASHCVGMRFHSVVFQTVLNGQNCILDYTDPDTGKIGNFIRQIGASDFYQERYCNVQKDKKIPKFSDNAFALSDMYIEQQKKIYTENLSKLTI